MNPSINLFINQKGGVGKTTLLREIGFYLAYRDHKVLFVDCDPQGNLTKSLIENVSTGLYDALEDNIIHFRNIRDNLKLLSGDKRLASYAKKISSDFDVYTKIPTLLKDREFKCFDFIFLDIPPGFGTLTINGLASTDNILIPMSPSMYSMQGANDLMETINKIRNQLNPTINLLGVIINCFDPRPIITREIVKEIEESFSKRVFSTYFSRSIVVEEAIAARKGVIELLNNHKIMREIALIGEELLKRIEALNG